MIRVLLADDHSIVRAGVRLLLQREPDIEIVGEAEEGREAARKWLAQSGDLAQKSQQRAHTR